MKRILAISSLLFVSSTSLASVADCQSVYVGKIMAQKGYTFRVVFLDNPSDTSGSYWVDFNHWNEDDKKVALTLLTTAKATQTPVSIVTQESDGCSISSGQRLAKIIYY